LTGVVEVIVSAASAAASAVGSAASAVGGAFSAISPFVSGGLALTSAASQIVSGRQQAASQQLQAQQALIQGRSEQLRGEESVNQVREQMLKTLAAQNARYGAAGVVLDDGTPTTMANATTYEADRQTRILRGNASMAGTQATQRSLLLQDQAEATQTAGVIGAAGSLFNWLDRTSARSAGTVKSPSSSRIE